MVTVLFFCHLEMKTVEKPMRERSDHERGNPDKGESRKQRIGKKRKFLPCPISKDRPGPSRLRSSMRSGANRSSSVWRWSDTRKRQCPKRMRSPAKRAFHDAPHAARISHD